MNAQARAGLELQGNALRYAEVEQYGARYRLLRLGSCDFDFDVAREVMTADNPENLEVITDAISDVFEGTSALRMHVAMHPPGGSAFFSVQPLDLSDEVRRDRIEQEALLLTGATSAGSMYLNAEPVYSDVLDREEVVWHHVTALPVQVYARLRRVLRVLPKPDYYFNPSMQGGARIVQAVERWGQEDGREGADYTLTLGWYAPSHVEFILSRNGEWRFSHYADAHTAADGAFQAVTLLSRMGLTPADVRRLYVYGVDVDLGALAPFEQVFNLEVERLSPMRLVDLDPSSMASDFDASAYVPCIGVAL